MRPSNAVSCRKSLRILNLAEMVNVGNDLPQRHRTAESRRIRDSAIRVNRLQMAVLRVTSESRWPLARVGR